MISRAQGRDQGASLILIAEMTVHPFRENIDQLLINDGKL